MMTPINTPKHLLIWHRDLTHSVDLAVVWNAEMNVTDGSYLPLRCKEVKTCNKIQE
jgi:hypothetical protein